MAKQEIDNKSKMLHSGGRDGASCKQRGPGQPGKATWPIGPDHLGLGEGGGCAGPQAPGCPPRAYGGQGQGSKESRSRFKRLEVRVQGQVSKGWEVSKGWRPNFKVQGQRPRFKFKAGGQVSRSKGRNFKVNVKGSMSRPQVNVQDQSSRSMFKVKVQKAGGPRTMFNVKVQFQGRRSMFKIRFQGQGSNGPRSMFKINDQGQG